MNDNRDSESSAGKRRPERPGSRGKLRVPGLLRGKIHGGWDPFEPLPEEELAAWEGIEVEERQRGTAG
jgi:hypothetical protein